MADNNNKREQDQNQEQKVRSPSAGSEVARERKINPVYEWLKAQVLQTNKELRDEWKQSESQADLQARNRGVKCYMKPMKQIFESLEALQNAILQFRSSTAPIEVNLWNSTGVEAAYYLPTNPDCALLALYSPDSAPLRTIFNGIPCELTDFAVRSTLIWQLRAPSLYLPDVEPRKHCELYANTAFFIPNVQLRKTGWECTHGRILHGIDERDECDRYTILEPSDRMSTNVVLMSDVECVLHFLEERDGGEPIKVSKLIHNKIMTPFYMALRQNQNRLKLNLPPIRHIVFSDMGLRVHEPGINTLFVQRLQSALKMFQGCFDSVTICAPERTLLHLSIALVACSV